MALTQAQRAERIDYIGSTDAAAVMGLSRYKTPLSLYAEKTGAVIQGADRSGELPIWMGNRLEDVIAERFTFETGIKVQRVKEVQVHPEYPFLRAQIDRRVVGSEGEILECKTASAFKGGDWEGEDIPSEYIIQVLHQLMVLGAIAKAKGLPPPPFGHIACLVGGNVDFIRRKIEYDETMIADLEAKEVRFWNEHVLLKKMPGVTAHDQDTLNALFPNARVDEEPTALPADLDAIIERIKEIGTDKSGGLLQTLKDEKNELENEVRMAMGDTALGVVGKWKVTWKEQETSRLDAKTLSGEMPEVYAKYLNVGSTRVLRIADATKAKGKK